MEFRLKKVLALALAFAFSTSFAQDSKWSIVSKTKLGNGSAAQYDVLHGSGKFVKNDGERTVYVATFRFVSGVAGRESTIYEQNYVHYAECVNGAGGLVSIEMAGQFKFKTDFVLAGSTVADAIADILCVTAQKVLENTEKRVVPPVKAPLEKFST